MVEVDGNLEVGPNVAVDALVLGDLALGGEEAGEPATDDTADGPPHQALEVPRVRHEEVVCTPWYRLGLGQSRSREPPFSSSQKRCRGTVAPHWGTRAQKPLSPSAT